MPCFPGQPCWTEAKTQIHLLNLHLAKFVFQMKSVNHVGARRCAGELQTKPVQFSALPTRGSASSKLLHINLFCCSISYVNCSRPYCERRPKTSQRTRAGAHSHQIIFDV